MRPPAKTGDALAARLVFGGNLRRARQAARLTQRDITARGGFTQGFISELEVGKQTISMDNAFRLAGVIGVPLWTLLKPEAASVPRVSQVKDSAPKKGGDPKPDRPQ